MVAGLDEGGDAFGSYFVGGDFIPLPLNIRTRLMYGLLKSDPNKRNQPPILHPRKKRMTLKYIIMHRHAHRQLQTQRQALHKISQPFHRQFTLIAQKAGNLFVDVYV